jgi:Outer membrane protein beta-barrel domain
MQPKPFYNHQIFFMKRIILSAFVFSFFITSTVHAQKARIGFSAGLTMAQVRTKVDNEKDNSKLRAGFSVGVMADLSLAEQFSFQPALNFLQKGGKENLDFGGMTAKYTITLNYLELPLNFVYRSKGEKGHFIAGIGPSLAFGLSGKAKFSGNGQTDSEKIHFGSGDDDDAKPFEFGGNVLLGFESSKGILVTFNYNMGISNISTDSESKWKNSYFGLKLGYLLNHK